MQLGDKFALQACLSVSPSYVLSRYPNLMMRKMDMQSCACPAVMEHTQLSLSTRYQRSPTWCFPRLLQHCFPHSHLLFSPPENPAPGLPLLLVIYQGKFWFLQLGHCEVVEEEDK